MFNQEGANRNPKELYDNLMNCSDRLIQIAHEVASSCRRDTSKDQAQAIKSDIRSVNNTLGQIISELDKTPIEVKEEEKASLIRKEIEVNLGILQAFSRISEVTRKGEGEKAKKLEEVQAAVKSSHTDQSLNAVNQGPQ